MLNNYRLLLEMMTPMERRRFWTMVGITFVLTLFEVASVLSILPFLRLLSDLELIQTSEPLAWLYAIGGFQSPRSFVIATGLAVLFITVVGLGMKMLTIWLTTRFALMRSYSFSARLLANYFHQPYAWFLTRHTADLGNAILAEVDKVVREATLPAMRVIPETFAVFLLIMILFLIEPEIAIAGAVLLGGVYGLIFLAVRQMMVKLGATKMDANKARFHTVQEATGGLKELKIMGLEDRFLHRFRFDALRMARAETQSQVVLNLPRQGIEAVAFGGMISLVLYLLLRDDESLAGIVPTLGLIAMVALRLIPALQQVYYRLTSLKNSETVLKRIHSDLIGLSIDPEDVRARRGSLTELALTDSLQLSGLGYTYPTAQKPALNDLSLTINAKSSVGIVGGTGAGKTTLVDIILGLLVPETGTLHVNGVEVTDESRRSWQKTLGYVPQTIFLTDGTVADNIAFGLERDDIDMARVEEAARIAALHDFVTSELPEGYQTHVGERGVRLSGGQRQRIGIARALYHDPSVLIFDEATSALDTLTEAAVMEAVGNLAGVKTVIMIAHRLTTVKSCDRIFLMRHGRIVAQGTFDELVATDEEFRKMAHGTSS